MAIQFNASARNARLDAIETEVKGSATMHIYTGSVPASCGVADSGTRLASVDLTNNWMADASGDGTKVKSGTWSSVASAAGTMGYFRVKTSAGVGGTTYIQGTITSTGGAGDLKFDNIDAVSAQTVTITTFTLTDGNA